MFGPGPDLIAWSTEKAIEFIDTPFEITAFKQVLICQVVCGPRSVSRLIQVVSQLLVLREQRTRAEALTLRFAAARGCDSFSPSGTVISQFGGLPRHHDVISRGHHNIVFQRMIKATPERERPWEIILFVVIVSDQILDLVDWHVVDRCQLPAASLAHLQDELVLLATPQQDQ